MPSKPPPLPDATDLPEIEVDDDFAGALPADMIASERMSAEAEISDSLQDLVGQSFEDMPYQGPLDFHDGADMGRRPV